MRNLLIVGSSGHAKVAIDIAELTGAYRIVGLIDRFRSKGEETLGYRILGGEADICHLAGELNVEGVFIAVGDNFKRSLVTETIKAQCPGLSFINLIHPAAIVARSATLGEGTVLMAGAKIGACSRVGDFCIVNTGASLDHDGCMEDFSSLAPGAILGGHVHVGRFAAICLGTSVIERISIGEHAVIGAGAVVVHNIAPYTLAYGIPAKPVKARKPGDRYLT